VPQGRGADPEIICFFKYSLLFTLDQLRYCSLSHLNSNFPVNDEVPCAEQPLVTKCDLLWKTVMHWMPGSDAFVTYVFQPLTSP